MFNTICDMAKLFPRVNLTNSMIDKIALKEIRPDIEFEKYGCMAIVIALAFGSVVGYLSGQFLAILFVFLAVFYLIMNLPKTEFSRRKARIESELPFFLRNFGMLICMGISFEHALALGSDGHEHIRKEIRIVLNRTAKGISIQKALAEFGTKFESNSIKRAVSQLMLTYETGGSGSEIRKVGDDIMLLEQHRLKEYAAKSSVFGLMFVMTSAILPTFFIVYSITGGIGIGASISKDQMFVGLLVIFPAISGLILLLSKTTMPHSALNNGRWFEIWLLLPAVFITIGTFLIEARMIFFALGLVAGAWLIAKNFKKEQKLEKLENDIPDALFAISSMPGSLGLERVFMTIENGGFGELSKEIGIARKQLAINIKPETVVDCLIAKNRSVLLREMVIMLRQMIETNSLGRTGELADDIIRHIQTRRERSQLLATQKYTLMLGAVLIPLILKTTIGLVSSMGSVFSNSDLTGVLSDCNLLLPPYLVIYVSMVSIAIADSEGKRSSANLYLVVLSAISLATFYFINI